MTNCIVINASGYPDDTLWEGIFTKVTVKAINKSMCASIRECTSCVEKIHYNIMIPKVHTSFLLCVVSVLVTNFS